MSLMRTNLKNLFSGKVESSFKIPFQAKKQRKSNKIGLVFPILTLILLMIPRVHILQSILAKILIYFLKIITKIVMHFENKDYYNPHSQSEIV